MKKLILLTIVMALLLPYSICLAQNFGYGQYYQLPAPPAPYYQQYGNSGGFPPYGFYFHLAPSPWLIHRWDLRNRAADLEALQRSPLNPESDVEYMLRNFD
ncbi:MAG TPA: hypothetical protein VMC85_20410 [Desulfomonilaceae bacterium]|nr:hypothetical protein [Desulfomonilaceae bacterium]